MKVEVDEELIMGMAEEFQTTPERMVARLLDFMDRLSPVRANGESLEDAIKGLVHTASAGHVFNALIDEAMEGRSYSISGCRYIPEDESMLFTIEPVESDHIDGMRIQFGGDAFTSAKFSLEADEDEHGQYKDEFGGVIDSCEDWIYGDLRSASGNTMRGKIHCHFEALFESTKISQFEEIIRRVKRLHEEEGARS